MSLRLRAATTEEIHAQLSQAYPEEGCGVMLGNVQGESRDVERVIVFENQREDSRHNRYLISPAQLLAAEKEARANGLEVIGFFHSHPDHPACPSAFDLEHAWPYYSYLIVSVERGKASVTQSWRLAEDRSGFEPEPIEPSPKLGRSTGSGETKR